MQARKFPATQGWPWLRAGFMLWRRAPLALTAACLTLMMVLMLSMLLPVVGQFAPPLLLLPLGVGLFILCNEIVAARPAAPSLLFRGFRLNLPAQIMIGALRILSQLLCFWLAGQIVGMNPDTPLLSMSADGKTLNMAPDLLPFMSWGLLLGLPLEMLFWFAPQLVALAGLHPLKAMFFSCVACWRNILPILLCYGLWALFFGLLPALVLGLVGSMAPELASLLSAPVAMLMMPVFYAAFHASACDIFGSDLQA